MIIKVDGVTAERLLRLKTFIGSPGNLFAWDQNLARILVGDECTDDNLANIDISKWYHPLKIIKCEGKTIEKNEKVDTLFNLVIEVEEFTGREPTRRRIINQLLDILDLCTKLH